MKRIFDGERMVAVDGEHELGLGWCGREIRNWKRWYFRKNSKYPAEIRLRCWSAPSSPDFWKMYLELSINNKMKYQTRICAEAYDVLQKDKPRTEYQGLEFVTLETFQPNKVTTT